MQANYVLRLSKPRQEQRPPASVALEGEVWRDYPQMLQKGIPPRFIRLSSWELAH